MMREYKATPGLGLRINLSRILDAAKQEITDLSVLPDFVENGRPFMCWASLGDAILEGGARLHGVIFQGAPSPIASQLRWWTCSGRGLQRSLPRNDRACKGGGAR